jgi:hypothetical protein
MHFAQVTITAVLANNPNVRDSVVITSLGYVIESNLAGLQPPPPPPEPPLPPEPPIPPPAGSFETFTIAIVGRFEVTVRQWDIQFAQVPSWVSSNLSSSDEERGGGFDIDNNSFQSANFNARFINNGDVQSVVGKLYVMGPTTAPTTLFIPRDGNLPGAVGDAITIEVNLPAIGFGTFY